MERITNLKGIEGLTITKVVHTDEYTIGLFFGNKYLVVSVDSYGDGHNVLFNEELYDLDKRNLGLISHEEYDLRMEKEEKQRNAVNEKYKRLQYEKLKKEFEDGNTK